ncbi:MAG: YceI family protein [Acidobacteriia bacterium]|nr:YceI family protein [Terriglobia bacterium]
MHRLFILGCLASLAFGETAFDLDPAKTDINFTLHDVLHTVHGTFKLKRGAIQFDPATGKAGGEIVIDAASGASGSGSRDKRMHKEILESQKYPEAVFVPDNVQGRLETEGESQLDVHGVFKIHGADHELTLHLLVDAQGGGRYTASTHFFIPYVKWGMKNPSNFFLKVDDTVAMDIKASAAAKP